MQTSAYTKALLRDKRAQHRPHGNCEADIGGDNSFPSGPSPAFLSNGRVNVDLVTDERFRGEHEAAVISGK